MGCSSGLLRVRADAARRALTDALAGMVGVEGVSVSVADATIAVAVELAPAADRTAVESVLAGYALECRIVVRDSLP